MLQSSGAEIAHYCSQSVNEEANAIREELETEVRKKLRKEPETEVRKRVLGEVTDVVYEAARRLKNL